MNYPKKIELKDQSDLSKEAAEQKAQKYDALKRGEIVHVQLKDYKEEHCIDFVTTPRQT